MRYLVRRKRAFKVSAQGCVGNWDGDSIIGKNHECPLSTLLERCTVYTAAAKRPDKRDALLSNSATAALKDIDSRLFHPITVDNDKEFAALESLEKQLDVKIYFDLPDTSNDWGINGT